jgi:hypothetical protein
MKAQDNKIVSAARMTWDGRAELGDDGAERRQRRGHGEHQDRGLPLVLARGALADPMDAGRRHHVGHQRQVEADGNIPADEHARREPPVGQAGDHEGDEQTDTERDEESRPVLDDTHRGERV